MENVTESGLTDKSKRDLFRGSLDVLVLAALAEGRQYGYSIQKQIRFATGQTAKPSALYPLLHRLEEAGLIEAEWEAETGRERKWYAITEAGREQFKVIAAEWQAMFARMQGQVMPALRRTVRHAGE